MSANPVHNQDETSKAPSMRPIRVWQVDDCVAISEALAEGLGSHSELLFDRQFATGENALQALKQTRQVPEVLLLDLNLGDQCGLDYIKPMLTLCPSLRILVFTTFNDMMSEVHAVENGASGFLLKSYGLEEIARLIKLSVSNPNDPQLFRLTRLYSRPQANTERPKTSVREVEKTTTGEACWSRLIRTFWGWSHRPVLE